ncbi:uncharacterized protein LOC6650111 isoform X2 [Drosophila willistoni]|uniref:uncharacterized protein LOC6650111 isoform X2 n=1 Tax=Drosophila willistoni TaxID=7260 RepID=UPI000C26C4C9|nr:uncharacterized protein LOC6650111 isoform X2 [Drosophila willistoni]
MPKKVITRRQRKAAEAKRQADEDARLVVPGDKASPVAADRAAGPTSLPPVGGPRGQKRKANNNIETLMTAKKSTRDSNVVEPSSSPASPMVRTSNRSPCYETGKPIPMPQLPPISEALTEMDTQRSSEHTNRLAAMLPFGTRLCRRIARRFRSVSLSGLSNKENPPQQSLEEPQPTLKQLNALHKMLMQKRKRPWQDDFYSNLKYPGRNRSEAVECGEVEKQTNELMQKYLQRFYDGCDDYSEANQIKKPTPKAANPSKQNCEKQTGTTHPRHPMPVVSRSAMEQRPPLKIIGNTGYFILTGTDSQLAQQLNDLTTEHESLGQCLLLLGGMSDHVEDQLYTLEENRDQIFKQMDDKYAMLEPKRERRQRRPKKHKKNVSPSFSPPQISNFRQGWQGCRCCCCLCCW